MLHSCIPFADVVDRMKRREEISIEITPEEWDKVKYIQDYLKILNDCKFLVFWYLFSAYIIRLVLATVLLSGQEYPTIHLVLPCLVQLETQWLRATNDIVHFLKEVAETMLRKFYKYYSTFPNLLVFAHALNPVYKLDFYSMRLCIWTLIIAVTFNFNIMMWKVCIC
jgi:sulfur relay (sulfurtransferase) DsrC/TusE family protein